MQVVPNAMDRDLNALVLVIVGQRNTDVTFRPVARHVGFVGLRDDFLTHRISFHCIWG